MEDSDDDLSYISASESEAECQIKGSVLKTASGKAGTRWCSSPAASLSSRSSFRRLAPKRPAPQPPVASPKGKMPPVPYNDSGDVEASSSPPKLSAGECQAFVSHPIHLVPSRIDANVTSHSKSHEGGDTETAVPREGCSITKRQIRLIDDVLDPLSQCLPLPLPSTSSVTSSPSSITTPLAISPAVTSSFLSAASSLANSSAVTSSSLPVASSLALSPAVPSSSLCFASSLAISLTTSVTSSTSSHPAASPYASSVSGLSLSSSLPGSSSVSSFTPLSPLSPLSSLSSPFFSNQGVSSMPIYQTFSPLSSPLPSFYSSPIPHVTPLSHDPTLLGSVNYSQVTPLSYMPHYGAQLPPFMPPTVLSQPPISSAPFRPFFSTYPCSSSDAELDREQVTHRRRNPLSHSASDPGVNQMLRSGILPNPVVSSLDRLSETEECDDDSYEEVFYRHEECNKLVPVKPKKHFSRSLERSDSVGVAHIYEDLLFSPRLNLKVTFTNLTMVVIIVAFLMPNSATILYNFFRLVFGTLFPAYYSYKAVRTKNVKEYVKWMMYWIVFAFFTCAETITDVFVSFWFPFYYEIKILVVLWLLSPATRGSSTLYRKFVHPWLTKKEEEIDCCIAKAKQQGYSTVVQLGTKGVNYATTVIMQTALKGGGGLVNQLKRSYSASEIGEDTADVNRNVKPLPSKEVIQSPTEEDDVSISSGSYESEPPRHRSESESYVSRPRGHSTGRSVRSSKTRSADVSEYFHDSVDVAPQRRSPRTHDAGRTTEGHQNVTRRSRSGDVPYATLPRATKRTTVKKKQT